MDEKTIEELFPVIVKSYNEGNYEHASMVIWFIYSDLEETKTKLSPINTASVVTLLKLSL